MRLSVLMGIVRSKHSRIEPDIGRLNLASPPRVRIIESFVSLKPGGMRGSFHSILRQGLCPIYHYMGVMFKDLYTRGWEERMSGAGARMACQGDRSEKGVSLEDHNDLTRLCFVRRIPRHMV